MIKTWNRLDSALYEHFLGKLEDKIKAYGREEMARDVETLIGRKISIN